MGFSRNWERTIYSAFNMISFESGTQFIIVNAKCIFYFVGLYAIVFCLFLYQEYSASRKSQKESCFIVFFNI